MRIQAGRFQAVRIQAGRVQASGDFAERGLRSGRTGDMRHEQTIVYQKSVQLMETAQALIGELPAGLKGLALELVRMLSKFRTRT
ncbi:MAG: hypothetical protein DYH12_09935 [Sorangiineae bacterium PRO1]|nr:hypothetical protein [Sorangiineae bacterium PRO1]